MDDPDLSTLLDKPGDAFRLCRVAVADGAALTIHPEAVATGDLRAIYQRRLKHFSRIGANSVGFAEAVAALQATEIPALRIAKVEGEGPTWFFQLFLHPDTDEALACIAIDRTAHD